MCSQCRADEEAEKHEQYELTALARIPGLPTEIQQHIVRFCDLQSLGVLCQLSKEWNAAMTPLLWRHLDFVEAFDDVHEAVRLFFSTCDKMLEESPERFAVLAGHVKTLDVGRLHGINIVYELDESDSDYIYFDEHLGARCVFDVIARFSKLEALSLYMKNWWGYENDLKTSANELTRGLKNLKSLKLGGQMSDDVLRALMNQPEELRQLTLVNLHISPGQDHGPEAGTYVEGNLHARLASLETLHLVTLADLEPRLTYSDDGDNDGSDEESDDQDSRDEEYVSGMRWRFPRGGQSGVLHEWASLLKHVSKTLRVLTLENRYLVGYGFGGDVIDPGTTHPENYGVFSLTESQRVILPAISEQEWPQLRRLTLVGMGAVERVNLAVAHLGPQVVVEQRPGRIEYMGGDATPEQVSTPVEFHGDR